MAFCVYNGRECETSPTFLNGTLSLTSPAVYGVCYSKSTVGRLRNSQKEYLLRKPTHRRSEILIKVARYAGDTADARCHGAVPVWW